MVRFTCRGCGASVHADKPPVACARCYRPGEQAFGDDDAPSVELAAPPTPIERAALSPQRTEELGETDILVAGPPAAPLSPARTEELADGDLKPLTPKEMRDLTGPVRLARRDDLTGPVRLTRARLGSVTFPIGQTARPAALQQTHDGEATTLPRGVDEAAVAGLPPSAPRRNTLLTSQTETLAAGIRARRRRHLRSLGGGIAIVVAALVGYRLLQHRPARVVSSAADMLLSAPIRVLDGAVEPEPAEPQDGGVLDAAATDGGLADRSMDRRVSARWQRRGVSRAPRPDRGATTARAPDLPAAKAAYDRGLQALLLGSARQAAALFRQSSSLAPRFALAYRGLGLAQEKLGEAKAARQAYERYLKLAPDASDAAAIRARLVKLTPRSD